MIRRLTAVALVVLLTAACTSDDDTGGGGTPPPDGAAAPEGLDGVVAVEIESRQHTEDSIDYPNRPPLGGDHYPLPAPCQFYGSLEDRPPDELVVHSLEHGAVWIAFQEDLPDDQQEFISQATGAGQVIATPYEGLRSPVVMTAWGRQLDLDSVDDPRFEEFLSTYVDGPTAPEADRDCVRSTESGT